MNVNINNEGDNKAFQNSGLAFDPNTPISLELINGNDSSDSPLYVVLGHEIAHSYDHLKRENQGAWIEGGTWSDSEIFATHIENLIRTESGLSQRIMYGGRQTQILQNKDKPTSYTTVSLYFSPKAYNLTNSIGEMKQMSSGNSGKSIKNLNGGFDYSRYVFPLNAK